MERIGIFGGTYNPPHLGHIGAAVYGKTALNLDFGDNIVLTAGPINGQHGNTNTIKVEQI